MTGGFFDKDGFPNAAKRGEVDVPGVTDPEAYALEITGDSMLPVYRPGHLIIVSPKGEMRDGDRVVLKTITGEVIARIPRCQEPRIVRQGYFDQAKPDETRERADIE